MNHWTWLGVASGALGVAALFAYTKLNRALRRKGRAVSWAAGGTAGLLTMALILASWACLAWSGPHLDIPALRIAGGPLAALGAWLYLVSALRVGRLRAPKRYKLELDDTGVYSLVRHPQALALSLLACGTALLSLSVPFLLSLPLWVGVWIAYAYWEEKNELLPAFGPRYEEYRRRVPAFLPNRASWRAFLRSANDLELLRIWKLKMHWQILLAILTGVLTGFALQSADADLHLGFEAGEEAAGVAVRKILDPELEGKLRVGDRLLVLIDPGSGDRFPVSNLEEFRATLRRLGIGFRARAVFDREGERLERLLQVAMAEDSERARLLAPFHFVANLFLRLLQMLIVPLILTSIVTGVASIGRLGDLGRIGVKTLAYYMATSLLAILVGLALVNLIRPGVGASLPLEETVDPSAFERDEDLFGIFLRTVPENVFGALSDNGRILQVIFFSILLGVFITRVGGESGRLLARIAQAGFDVMMQIAEFVLLFIPLGVFALIARVVAVSGLEVFRPLIWLMLTVVLALAVHACFTLPSILFLLGRIRPWRWAQAVAPALLTAFSTSSSSITLPVTLRSVEERGKVSNRTASFVLPLGATINMDGTALYECVAVIFLAQYYAGVSDFTLTFGGQLLVVITALLASIGAAGIPSAGLVMMTTILKALGLPLEAVPLLLAIDRPLDMLRTAVNVWSDTTCTAVVAATEGETEIAGRIGRAA